MTFSVSVTPSGTTADLKVGTAVAATLDSTGITLPGNAVSPLQAVTLQQVQDFVNSNVIGVNQSWQNLTSSRVLNTTYTNNTSRPIMVHITVQFNDGSGPRPYIRLLVNDVEADFSAGGEYNGSNYAGYYGHVNTIVPVGAIYRVQTLDGVVHDLGIWTELR